MDIKEIMKLIQAVSDYSLTSFELEEGNMKISLKREKEVVSVAAPTAVLQAVQSEAQGGTFGVVTGGVPAGVPGVSLAAGQEAQAAGGVGIPSDQVINSPLVGTFYSSASPEADAFVKVGDRVKKGQVLGIIEAMKLMNEIESEYDGVVEAILVNNEDVVEYGQPLFRIGA